MTTTTSRVARVHPQLVLPSCHRLSDTVSMCTSCAAERCVCGVRWVWCSCCAMFTLLAHLQVQEHWADSPGAPSASESPQL